LDQTFGELLGAEIRECREAAGMTQRELAAESFNDPDKTDTYERRIRELESDAPPANPRAKTYQPLCDTLNITRDQIRAMKAQAANRREQETMEREELREDIGPLSDALNDPSGLSRTQLIALAELFGAEKPEAQPDAALREFLTQKAEEYRTYSATIDALDDRVAAIANLKGAAQDAAAKLDFDEVEILLSRVDEVETEIAAETKVARAQNALLRNDPDTAFTILSAAADSFASIDPLEPARKRGSYEDLLYQHGLRYPGPALDLAARMNHDALGIAPRDTDAPLWAALQINLGAALGDLGTRAGDTAALDDAVTAYRAALEVHTRQASPMDWAMTQNNLGTALGDLGTRAGDTAALDDAVTAYREALEVYTRQASPMQWAMTQNNLGNALADLGTRAGDTDALTDAVTAYRAALEVHTRADSPLLWAMTQNNLGVALRNLGARAGDTAALQEAVAAYRAALEVRTREASPMDWAMTQNNLGSALRNLGARAGDTAALRDAVAAYRAALEVLTREASPMDWAMTQNNLGNALANLGARAGDTAALEKAITAYRAALEVRTREAAPLPFAETMENLAIAHLARATLPDAPDCAVDLATALDAVDTALEVYTPEHTPYRHEQATRLREDILAAQADTT
jgi:transcriptional regulator with XRE-family HTH domain